MTDTPPNVVTRYIGDDWTVGPVTLTDDGLPANLTGCAITGLFFVREQLLPVATLTETIAPAVGGITVATDRTTGVLTEVWVAAEITSKVVAQERCEPSSPFKRDFPFPTRLAIVVTDSRGRERTFLIILFQPLNRRTDVPSVVLA